MRESRCGVLERLYEVVEGRRRLACVFLGVRPGGWKIIVADWQAGRVY